MQDLTTYFQLHKQRQQISIYLHPSRKERSARYAFFHPLDNEIVFMPCCGKYICGGCMFKNMINEMKNKPKKDCAQVLDEHKCALCRQPPSGETTSKYYRKLLKNKNPDAFMHMAALHRDGEHGVLQSDTKSLEMYIRAAELGHADAFGNIGTHYEQGIAVEQDMLKALAFYEVAAKKESIPAHKRLARYHQNVQNSEESIKHFKVAASAGDQESMDRATKAYRQKLISKEDLAQTLRAHQASQNEMKSEDRDIARMEP